MDISFEDEHISLRQLESQSLNLIRKESLDLLNRLHSIAEDALFVQRVHKIYPTLPVIPNLRCGEWYTNPEQTKGNWAYFKSTDGHFNNWSFNLRRPNLHLLSTLSTHSGFIIVDSTRSGKRLPDALSKTVPIWCAVVNRAVVLRKLVNSSTAWDHSLYTPPASVSAQERAQIESKIENWALELARSSYEFSAPRLPLRPFWITPNSNAFPELPENPSFIPIICVSASRQVESGIDRRASGYIYVQGSGDDHELWGKGLSPVLFWEHRNVLLRASRGELATLVETLTQSSRDSTISSTWRILPTSIHHVSDRLQLTTIHDLPTPLPLYLQSLPDNTNGSPLAYVLIQPSPVTKTDTIGIGPTYSEDPSCIQLTLPEGKRGQSIFLKNTLPQSQAFIRVQLRANRNIIVACDTGKDASVGVILTALQMFFNDDGQLSLESPIPASKESIHTRLQWIIMNRPAANPSRTTLKRINDYLLSPKFSRP